MTPSPLTAALVFVGFGILVTSAYAWLIAAAKAALSWGVLSGPLAIHVETLLQSLGLSPRLPLVPWTPRRPVTWALIDLIFIVGLLIIAAALLDVLRVVPRGNIEDLTLSQKESRILWNFGISLLIAVASAILVMIRTGATSSDLGCSWRDLPGDIRLGLIGFVMLAPPVYALQGLLVSFWKESKHPIVEMFKDAPNARFFGMLLLSAAVVAPLFEELIFRVLLQGFLEKAFNFSGSILELLVSAPTQEISNPSAPADVIEHLPGDVNPYASPQAGDTLTQRFSAEPDQPQLRGSAAWLPIAISSTIFALLHYSHGPDWIPLLPLAAGMGYLYQRTHRILPSLVVHLLLNSLSMWGLWVAVKERAITP